MSTMQSTMSMLFEHAWRSLDGHEMGRVAALADAAADEARRLSVVCEGIGCLVGNNGDAGGSTGVFRDADALADLMFVLSHSLDTIAAMAEVGNEAVYHVHKHAAGSSSGTD